MVVAGILALTTWLLTPGTLGDWLATLGVQLTFHYVSVASRLSEAHALHPVGEVHCRQWLLRYLIAKETVWAAAFLYAHLYPPLVGTVLFLLYPWWRRYWRRRHPRLPIPRIL